MTEPEIIINGTRLNMAQAMTVRVGLELLLKQPTGPTATLYEIYQEHGNQARQLMMRTPGLGERP